MVVLREEEEEEEEEAVGVASLGSAGGGAGRGAWWRNISLMRCVAPTQAVVTQQVTSHPTTICKKVTEE